MDVGDAADNVDNADGRWRRRKTIRSKTLPTPKKMGTILTLVANSMFTKLWSQDFHVVAMYAWARARVRARVRARARLRFGYGSVTVTVTVTVTVREDSAHGV